MLKLNFNCRDTLRVLILSKAKWSHIYWHWRKPVHSASDNTENPLLSCIQPQTERRERARERERGGGQASGAAALRQIGHHLWRWENASELPQHEGAEWSPWQQQHQHQYQQQQQPWDAHARVNTETCSCSQHTLPAAQLNDIGSKRVHGSRSSVVAQAGKLTNVYALSLLLFISVSLTSTADLLLTAVS